MGMKKAKKVRSFFWYIGALIISLITVYPFLWMIATSFKRRAESIQLPVPVFGSVFAGELQKGL